MVFISQAHYSTPRLSAEKVQRETDLQEYLDKRVRFRVREAAGV